MATKVKRQPDCLMEVSLPQQRDLEMSTAVLSLYKVTKCLTAVLRIQDIGRRNVVFRGVPCDEELCHPNANNTPVEKPYHSIMICYGVIGKEVDTEFTGKKGGVATESAIISPLLVLALVLHHHFWNSI